MAEDRRRAGGILYLLLSVFLYFKITLDFIIPFLSSPFLSMPISSFIYILVLLMYLSSLSLSFFLFLFLSLTNALASYRFCFVFFILLHLFIFNIFFLSPSFNHLRSFSIIVSFLSISSLSVLHIHII